jgi:hypothetical protein
MEFTNEKLSEFKKGDRVSAVEKLRYDWGRRVAARKGEKGTVTADGPTIVHYEGFTDPAGKRHEPWDVIYVMVVWDRTGWEMGSKPEELRKVEVKS